MLPVEDMLQLRKWQEELEKMKLYGTHGVLKIDSKTLKNYLVPITTSNLTKLQIMQQAGVASLAQAKNINQSVISLLS